MAAGDAFEETATSGSAQPRAGRSFGRGDQIGRYVVEHTLGAGGMGVVYAAHDPDLDRRIAVKVLRGDASDESRARLLREARAMAKVNHANVITVYEVGSAGSLDFVAMELIDGGSLADWLRGGRRPRREVLRVFRAAGRGLAAAHGRGLVHRDFKPGNVLLGAGGKVVVTDFGLARGFEADPLAATVPAAAAPATAATVAPAGAIALDQTLAAPRPGAAADSTARRVGLDSADLSSTLTRTGAVLGTPAYMAPEQFAGDPVGPAADQFAFAVALWEGLTGERPFRGATLDELRAAVGKPPAGAGQLPRGQRAILLRALARSPGQRWRDLGAMLDAIDRAERRPRQLVTGVVVLVGAAAATALALRSPARPPAGLAPPVATCALTEDELTTAWSPAIANQLGQRFGAAPEWPAARAALDDFARQWRSERTTTCADAAAPAFHGRIACLAGLRDELAAATALLAQVPIEMIRGPGIRELLPMPQVCRSGRRAAMPPLPADPAVRAALSAIVRDGATARLTARGGDAKAAAALADAVVARARQLAYAPALALALETQATVAHLANDYPAALPLYAETATAAEAASADGVRAMARIGQLECGIHLSSDLAQIQQYAGQADAAIQRAGNDPILRAALDLTLGTVDAETGDLDRAISRTAAARATFLANHDARRAALALANEAAYRSLRAGPGDDAEVLALTRAAFEQTVAAFGDGHLVTENARLELGLRLVDTAPEEGRALIAAATAARPIPPPPPDAIHLRGRVQASDGSAPPGTKVYAGAVLVATSDGEPLALADLEFASAPVGADGRFDLLATPGAMVYATAPGWSSLPTRATGPGPIEVRLEPAASITVHVTSQHPTAPAGAERALELGAHVAELGVALLRFDASRAYQSYARRTGARDWAIEVAPAGSVKLGLMAQSALGDSIFVSVGVTTRAGVSSPVELAADLRGQVVDVIVRADRAAPIPTARVIIRPGRGGRLPRTNLEVYRFIADAARTHVTSAAPVVEATRTQAGAALYQPGDIHGRLAAIPVGPATICVLPLAGDVRDVSFMRALVGAEDLEVRCIAVQVTAGAGVQAFVIETPPMKRRPPAP